MVEHAWAGNIENMVSGWCRPSPVVVRHLRIGEHHHPAIWIHDKSASRCLVVDVAAHAGLEPKVGLASTDHEDPDLAAGPYTP